MSSTGSSKERSKKPPQPQGQPSSSSRPVQRSTSAHITTKLQTDNLGSCTLSLLPIILLRSALSKTSYGLKSAQTLRSSKEQAQHVKISSKTNMFYISGQQRVPDFFIFRNYSIYLLVSFLDPGLLFYSYLVEAIRWRRAEEIQTHKDALSVDHYLFLINWSSIFLLFLILILITFFVVSMLT